MQPFATLEELKARLDWTLDADEERIAEGALEDASDMARFYGRDWIDAQVAPRMVRTLVLKACKRYMTNPAGYTQSRAGDETLTWNDDQGENAGTIYYTKDEQQLLAQLAGKVGPSIYSAPLTVWRTKLPEGSGTVPVEYGGDPFPMFSSETSPW